MIKKILKFFLYIISGIFLLVVFVLTVINFPVKNKIERADLGVTFSSRYASDIGLNWRENYIAMLDDLKVRKVRIPVYWDLVEKEKNNYDFSDIDWQLEEAQKRDAEIILTIGQKVPRWPECFIPAWIKDDKERKMELIEFLKIAVKRYKDNGTVRYWQVENEPFLKFGVCPALDVGLFDQELKVVKQMDPNRKIIVTDSGELSTWLPAAKRADVFGTTMYRNVYKHGWGYYVYPIGPRFFLMKQWLIDKFANQENAIVIELQGEPWVAGWTVHQPLEEQFKSMNEKKLVENVLYAQKSGFSEIYIWGVEWWYWLKTTQNLPVVWDTAKNMFEDNFSEEFKSKIEKENQENIIKNNEEEINKNSIISASDSGDQVFEKINVSVPFTSQAPFGNWDEKHEEACEEASLLMVKAYLKNEKLDKAKSEEEIQKMIEFQIENYGDYKDTNAEETVQLAKDFYGIDNLEVIYDFEKEAIRDYLSQGKPIIVPAAGRMLKNPYFTPPGPLYHNLVLTGFTKDDVIIANDPGTRRGEGYEYDLDILYEAIHDFTGEKEQINEGRKAMIVVK